MENGVGLLDGVRVIDLTRVLAGPYCTMILGDLGADIIKIEHPERGDDTRHWGPPFDAGGQSAYFLSANRNKRSLTLDMKTEKGLSILEGLIQEGDVLVDNFRPGTLERWGLSYKKLDDLRQGIIYCTITGYGYTGPYSDRPGYDFIVQALGGFMSVNGPIDGDPHRAGVAIADLASGIFAANAVLAALFRRERSGEGQRIDISLLDCMVALMSYVASNYLVSGENPKRYGNAHPNIVPYEQFKSKDGYIALAAGNDRQWAILCAAIGHPEWAEDDRFSTNPRRLENRELLVELVNQEIGRRDSKDWFTTFEEVGIPAAPINDMAQTFSDPQVQARNLRWEVPHPVSGTVPLIASPLVIPTSPINVRYPPPVLGQHTEEILSTLLGYDQTMINSLRQEGII